MLKEMRRKDRRLSEEESISILLKGEYGVLATVGADYPYAVPVNYVVLNDSIYIHGTCEMGQKSENIENNPKVCFTVVGDTEVLASKFAERYESIIVFGQAEISNEADKILALEEFINKYSSEYKESGMRYIKSAIDKVSIYKISIDKITGKARRWSLHEEIK